MTKQMKVILGIDEVIEVLCAIDQRIKECEKLEESARLIGLNDGWWAKEKERLNRAYEHLLTARGI